jgi:hypothetical protein
MKRKCTIVIGILFVLVAQSVGAQTRDTKRCATWTQTLRNAAADSRSRSGAVIQLTGCPGAHEVLATSIRANRRAADTVFGYALSNAAARTGGQEIVGASLEVAQDNGSSDLARIMAFRTMIMMDGTGRLLSVSALSDTAHVSETGSPDIVAVGRPSCMTSGASAHLSQVIKPLLEDQKELVLRAARNVAGDASASAAVRAAARCVSGG